MATEMELRMASIEIKNFDPPDDTRDFEGNGRVELVSLGDRATGRAVFEPGWRWSENVKPIAQTDSCQVDHFSYVVSGRMRVKMDNGEEAEITAGDVVSIPPGHDAEVIGDEPCVMIDVAEDAGYAKESA
jgi:mannose-6-phosphate isomerase-like protein (cupin superfamily)